MKKLFIFILIMLINSILFAGMIIPESQLPQAAKNFINQAFTGVKISVVEKETIGYDVVLSNGMTVEFNNKGEWSNIDSNYNPIPFSVLPENVANVVKSTYSDAIMIDVEKIGKNYKIELNNNVKMTIRPDGKIIRHRLDD